MNFVLLILCTKFALNYLFLQFLYHQGWQFRSFIETSIFILYSAKADDLKLISATWRLPLSYLVVLDADCWALLMLGWTLSLNFYVKDVLSSFSSSLSWEVFIVVICAGHMICWSWTCSCQCLMAICFSSSISCFGCRMYIFILYILLVLFTHVWNLKLRGRLLESWLSEMLVQHPDQHFYTVQTWFLESCLIIL